MVVAPTTGGGDGDGDGDGDGGGVDGDGGGGGDGDGDGDGGSDNGDDNRCGNMSTGDGGYSFVHPRGVELTGHFFAQREDFCNKFRVVQITYL